MNQARDRDNLLTRLNELARVAFGAIQAGPLAPFRCSAALFPHAVVRQSTHPSLVEERKSPLMCSRRCYGFSEDRARLYVVRQDLR